MGKKQLSTAGRGVVWPGYHSYKIGMVEGPISSLLPLLSSSHTLFLLLFTRFHFLVYHFFKGSSTPTAI